jgi:signal transduction histidine kinase
MDLFSALRWLGFALWALSGLRMFPDSLRGPFTWDSALWLACYLLFVVAYALGGSTVRWRRLTSLVVQAAMTITMVRLIPCYFCSLQQVIVAWQAALLFPPLGIASWIVVQTAVFGWLIVPACPDRFDALASLVTLLGFQAFSAVAVTLARREHEGRRELAEINAQLGATRALLEETSRVHERTRIARELHDVLGHDLTALGLQLEVARNLADGRSREPVDEARAISQRLLGQVREVVTTTRSTAGADVVTALRALANGIPDLAIHLELPPRLVIADPDRAHCLLRCVQELITNTLRHAGARNLWIRIGVDDDALTVDAHDDGRGVGELRIGNGLSGMRARLEELGGRLRIASVDRFAVSAWLPAKGPA